MAARKPAAKSEPKVELPEDDGGRINNVSRDEHGNSLEKPGFRLQIQEGASDAEKATAWNLGGELPPEEIIAYIPKPQV